MSVALAMTTSNEVRAEDVYGEEGEGEGARETGQEMTARHSGRNRRRQLHSRKQLYCLTAVFHFTFATPLSFTPSTPFPLLQCVTC